MLLEITPRYVEVYNCSPLHQLCLVVSNFHRYEVRTSSLASPLHCWVWHFECCRRQTAEEIIQHMHPQSGYMHVVCHRDFRLPWSIQPSHLLQTKEHAHCECCSLFWRFLCAAKALQRSFCSAIFTSSMCMGQVSVPHILDGFPIEVNPIEYKPFRPAWSGAMESCYHLLQLWR